MNIEDFDTTLLPELVDFFFDSYNDGYYKMDKKSIFEAMDESSIPKDQRKIAAHLWLTEYGAEPSLAQILREIISE